MNYREHMKKGECLLSAILWTAILTLHLKSTWYTIILPVLDVAALAVHWYRYLAYNKKAVKDE